MLRLWDATSGQAIHTLEVLTGGVTSVAFSPDGRHLLSGGSDGTLRLWDAASGQALRCCWADGERWFSLDMTPFQPAAHFDDLKRPRLRGKGPLPLAFVEKRADIPQAPWIPRLWYADDLPGMWLAQD